MGSRLEQAGRTLHFSVPRSAARAQSLGHITVSGLQFYLKHGKKTEHTQVL